MGVWGTAGLVPWNSFCLRCLDWRATCGTVGWGQHPEPLRGASGEAVKGQGALPGTLLLGPPMAGSCDPVLDGDRRCPGLCQLNELSRPSGVSGLCAGAAAALVVRLGLERNLSSSKFARDLGPELVLILVVAVVAVVMVVAVVVVLVVVVVVVCVCVPQVRCLSDEGVPHWGVGGSRNLRPFHPLLLFRILQSSEPVEPRAPVRPGHGTIFFVLENFAKARSR